jgi:UDPglucose 6-dehydrogenase
LEKFDVGVVGTGYVGLVTGACLAYVGHRVVCADKDEEKVCALGEGRMPIYEPGLEDMVLRGVSRGHLSFTTELSRTVREADVAFIAVDTPQGGTDRRTSRASRRSPGASGGRSRRLPITRVP